MSQVNTTINYDQYRKPIAFGSLLAVIIPASICTIFILAFFFSHWNVMIKKSLQHHAIFLLMIISFLYIVFDSPSTLSYFQYGYDVYRSMSVCLSWYWLHYSLLVMSLTITATASVQRHILIFHSHLLQIRRKRWIVHYLPLIISTIYPPLFYIIFMFLYPCTVYYDPDSIWCSYPCYLDDTLMYNIDWFINTILPVFIIVIANITLIIRVVSSMKRIRQQQRATWKQMRKLTLQLLSFSSLYLITWFPTTILAIIHSLFIPNLYTLLPGIYYMYYMAYFVCPLQTFPCMFALPEMMDFIKRKRHQITRRVAIHPTATIRHVN